MKKILIYTLYGNKNYGNKLQNFAVQKVLEKYGFCSKTVVMPAISNRNIMFYIKKIIKKFIPEYISEEKLNKERKQNFIRFDLNINKIKQKNVKYQQYDAIVVGSDQVWNPNDLLSQQLVSYVNTIKNKKIISLSASIAADDIPPKYLNKYLKQFKKIDYLSIREESGKKLIEKLTSRNDTEVLVDPTMLLDMVQWENVIKKPRMLTTDKYILTYFLGELSIDERKNIEEFAQLNNYQIIDILNKKDPFFTCGPDEFLYLEKNARLICTDSFHSSLFAIMFNTPFLVFDRKQKNLTNMYSRIETLLSKFDLKDRKYSNNISNEDLLCDYSKAYKILEEEKEKADLFLKKALDIEVNNERD